MRHLNRLACAAAALAVGLSAAHAQQESGTVPELTYTAQNRGPAPIPPSERGLQTTVAQPWFKVSEEGLQLEGPSFDRDGNLIFVEVFGGRVLKVTPDRKLSTVVAENKLAPAGLAIHKDGRIFLAGLGNFKDTGSLVAVKPDGSGMQTIIPPEAGYLVDDLIFDAKGGFYFTDFRGTSSEPIGGRLLRLSRLQDDDPGVEEPCRGERHHLEPGRQGAVGHRIQQGPSAPGRVG